jgi:hypothetical protein
VFRTDVDLCREAFLKELPKFPPSITDFIVAEYIARAERVTGPPLLGEIAPWILANILGITDYRSVRKIAVPWFFLYLYTLLVDDYLDRSETQHDSSFRWVASGMLLQRGIGDLFVALPTHHEKIASLLNSSFNETARAVVSEFVSHRGRIQSYDHRDRAKIGKKNSFAKLLAGVICLSADNPMPSQKQSLAIDHFLQALQLRDDITDWEEDLRSSTYTYLLTTTAERMVQRSNNTNSPIENLPADIVLLSFVLTGSLVSTLELSTSSINRVTTLVDIERTPLAYYLAYMANTNFRAICFAKSSYAALTTYSQRSKSEDWLSEFVTSPSGLRQIKRIRKTLKVITQNS